MTLCSICSWSKFNISLATCISGVQQNWKTFKITSLCMRQKDFHSHHLCTEPGICWPPWITMPIVKGQWKSTRMEHKGKKCSKNLSDFFSHFCSKDSSVQGTIVCRRPQWSLKMPFYTSGVVAFWGSLGPRVFCWNDYKWKGRKMAPIWHSTRWRAGNVALTSTTLAISWEFQHADVTSEDSDAWAYVQHR